MSVIGSNIIAGASGTVETGYQISRSLRFNSADSAYLGRTLSSTSNRQTFTWSGWIKIGKNPYSTGGYFFSSRQSGTDNFGISVNTSMQIAVDGSIGGTGFDLRTTPVYRDSSAWYHVLVAVDTTQATSSNRVKVYVNGSQVTAFGTATYPTQSNTAVNLNTAVHNVSGYNSSSNYFDGYMADVIFIDGQALDPTSFGETDANTGVWVPKAYTGTYGTNGFWLKFDDNSGTTSTTLGKDSSGNSNNWTPNNFSVTAGAGNDSLVDSPTNYGTDTGAGGEVRGNYATLNPLSGSSTIALANGNLQATTTSTTGSNRFATIGVSSGKWYWEYVNTQSTNGKVSVGIASNDNETTTYNSFYGYYSFTGQKFQGTTLSTYGATYTNNDVIGVAYDADAGTLTFYKNNVSQGTAFTGLSGVFFPFVRQEEAGGTTCSGYINFGQRPFAYTAPSGFRALNTQNLPTPAIGASSTTQADDYFNTIVYTGNGSSPRTVSGVGFQPDLVWVKNRSLNNTHTVHDVIRGAGSLKALYTSATAGESGGDTNLLGYLSAFTSDGFTATAGTTSIGYFNTNNESYVAWAWKANGAGVSNTAGSITSTVSANTTAGISIVTYTGNGSAGATVGHGLGVTPAMAIFKNRSATASWIVFHKAITTQSSGNVWDSSVVNIGSKSGGVLNLNLTAAAGAYNMDAQTNGSGNNHVAYCFAEIAGFSKFGSYTGNGSTDGPFVYCGFRPRYVMIKRTDAINDWGVYDTARNTYNLTNYSLYPNNSTAENGTWTTSENTIDILSNGFKVRASNAGANASGGTYIFAAFGEAPFNYSRAR